MGFAKSASRTATTTNNKKLNCLGSLASQNCQMAHLLDQNGNPWGQKGKTLGTSTLFESRRSSAFGVTAIWACHAAFNHLHSQLSAIRTGRTGGIAKVHNFGLGVTF